VPITMAFKLDNKGIGAKRFEKEARANGKADAWIGGGGELGDLFERLNKGSSTSASPIQVEETDAKEGKKDSRKRKSEKKASGESKDKKDRKGKGRKEEVVEADPVMIEEAVEKVTSALPHRMA
jgi:Pin2-interacting protein X1